MNLSKLERLSLMFSSEPSNAFVKSSCYWHLLQPIMGPMLSASIRQLDCKSADCTILSAGDGDVYHCDVVDNSQIHYPQKLFAHYYFRGIHLFLFITEG